MKRTIVPTPGAAVVHTHAEADVTSLIADLAAKAPLASPAFTGTPTGITKAHVGLGNVTNSAQLVAASNLSDLASASTARTNLGLGNVDNTSDANKPVSTAQQTALDGKWPTQPWPSGYYLFTAGAHLVTTNASLGTGTLRVLPWMVTKTISITRIGAEISTIGDVGSKLRLGIYSDNGSCYPGSLLIDAGQIAGDSATIQELTVSQSLTAGLYWVGGVVQSVTTTQPTVRVPSNWFPPITLPMQTTIPTANTTTIGYSMTGVTGALPGTFSATPATAGSVPRVFVKTA